MSPVHRRVNSDRDHDMSGPGWKALRWCPAGKVPGEVLSASFGAELAIVDNPPAAAVDKLDQTYIDLVAHRDEYWPEMTGVFDSDYVPAAGDRPKKTAVKAWMRLGKGSLGASRVSNVPWRFTRSDGSTFEKKFAKDPSRFGKGAIEGVAGPESANNAAAQTSFIPLLTLGIPGSASTAVTTPEVPSAASALTGKVSPGSCFHAPSPAWNR